VAAVGDGAGSGPSVCLVMIVRDAAGFVVETLRSVARFVDDWVVVDTGSTDDTAEVVSSFFAGAGIDGTLLRRPWVGFAHNRTEALAAAAGRADYALMLDADDVVVGELPLRDLDADAYRLRFGPDFVFWRTGLFRLNRGWEFRGAVHEYPVCVDAEADTVNLEGPYHVVFRSLGGRAHDPLRFQRDAEALLEEWDRAPGDPRTAFYLGQSFRDAGDLDRALAWYRQRLELGGWVEEAFVAALELGRCLERCGGDDNEVTAAYLAAWRLRPGRAEPLHAIARLHRERGRWADGYLAACLAGGIPLPVEDLLFVETGVYRWRIIDERSICAHHLGLHDESVRLCEQLLASADLPAHERERVLWNRDQSVPYAAARRSVPTAETVVAAVAHGRSAEGAGAGVTLTITTCLRRSLFERTVDSFLACCTDWRRIDRWICIDDGSTDEDRAAMRERYPFFEFIFNGTDERGHARSMNRLLAEVDTPYWLHLEDDWEFMVELPLVERSIEILDDDDRLLQLVFNRNYAETLEDRELVGGQPMHTSHGSIAYLRHMHLSAGSQELDDLFARHRGRSTNAHWPGFTLMPSMLRTAAMREVGAFNPGSGHFEQDFALRAAGAGWEVAFLDTIACTTTGPLRGSRRVDGETNAYELAGVAQFVEHPQRSFGLLPNWTASEPLHRQWRRQFPADGSWRGVSLADPADADPDYWLVINHPPPDRLPLPERTVVAHMEPSPWVSRLGDWAEPDPTHFLQVRSHRFAPNLLEWHLDLTYDELMTAGPVQKTRSLSAVVSSKRSSPGHHHRLDLIHALERDGRAVDVFGWDNNEGFRNHRGSLPPYDKRDGLLPYRYTIAVENHAENNYVTEKLVDALLAECLPFYWGCPNLEEFLEPQAFVRLPLPDIGASVELIRRTVLSGEYDRRLPAIRRAKRQILDDLQVAPILARIAHGASLVDSLDVRVVNLARRPDRLTGFLDRLQRAAGERFARRCRPFEAFDGRDLEPGPQLEHMFRGSPLPLRRAETACAISHLALWWEIATGEGRPVLIFEDDAEPVDGFAGRLIEVCGRLTDHGPFSGVAMLGLAYEQANPPPTSTVQHVRSVHLPGLMGGCHAYLLSQPAARQLWEIADRDGIPCAIDTFLLRHAAAVRAVQAVPSLADAPVARTGRPRIDSDIQYDAGRL
jgi:glycosyltransferase involved in cell wall biosynthesis/GR25 family glycosyltransferase involved in LPS biosynthesis